MTKSATVDLNALRRIACPPEIQDKLAEAVAMLTTVRESTRPVLATVAAALEAYEAYHRELNEELKGLPQGNELDASLESALYHLTPEVADLHELLQRIEDQLTVARGEVPFSEKARERAE